LLTRLKVGKVGWQGDGLFMEVGREERRRN